MNAEARLREAIQRLIKAAGSRDAEVLVKPTDLTVVLAVLGQRRENARRE